MTRICGMRCIVRKDRTDQGRVRTAKSRVSPSRTGVLYLRFWNLH